MGVTVRQKTKGKGNPWWVFIAHNGERTSRKIGDKAAAEKVASKIRAKLQLGEFDFEERQDPTFREYAASWIKITVPATCKPSTHRDYQDILNNHVLPIFGDLRIRVITRGKVKEFLLGKTNEGYAGSTVTHIKNVISGVLNKAVDDEVISTNPAHRIGKVIKQKDRKEDIDPLTAEELHILLDSTKRHFPAYYPLMLLLARTGLRFGEALALQWADIDWHDRFISVQRGLSRGRIELPKNGKIRRVDMSKQLTGVLREHSQKAKEKGLCLGLGELEWIFTDDRGKWIEPNVWRRDVFRKALKKAGLRQIRIHDLRHTYATLRIAKGDNIADVSNQLGHHSVKLTLDVYHHWIPGKKKSEVDELDELGHSNAPPLHPNGEQEAATAANA